MWRGIDRHASRPGRDARKDKDAADGNDLVADAPPIYIQEKIDQPEPS